MYKIIINFIIIFPSIKYFILSQEIKTNNYILKLNNIYKYIIKIYIKKNMRKNKIKK